MKNIPDKEALRQAILVQRRSLSADYIVVGSAKLTKFICSLPVFQTSSFLMAYLSMPDEPQTDAILSIALADGKTVSVPHLRKEYGMMDAAVIRNLDNLAVGRLGLRIPDPSSLALADPHSLDLIAVPGVAFDPSGNRIGMGAGYYDRFLSQAVNAYKIGVAWSFQVVDAIPNLPHDIPMDCLITEEGIVFCR